MGLMDLAAQVMGKTQAISEESKRSPEEVKSALQQGIKLIPDILANKDKGIAILQGLGMDKAFVGQMYQRFGSKASKFGLSDNAVRSALGVLENKLEQKQAAARGSIPAPPPPQSSGFDRSKYPLVK